MNSRLSNLQIILLGGALICISSLGSALEPGDFVTSGASHKKQIALTFDDGPGPFTEKFLDLLDKHQVKATFFVLGEQVKYKPQLAKEIVKRGHEIADHTYRHINYNFRYKDIQKELQAKGSKEDPVQVAKSELDKDMKSSQDIIQKTTGAKIRFCRMPNGIDRPWIKDVAKSVGYILVNWTYGADWAKGSAEQLMPAYLQAIKPDAIFLFHDGGSHREKSLVLAEQVIKTAKEKGFEIVPLSVLLQV